jgi:hypothetical protein
MANGFLMPAWFLGYDIIFKLLFAIVTLTISFYSFKVYSISRQRSSKLFGISFLFFSTSYIIQSALSFAIVSKVNENICTLVKINEVTTLNNIALTTHMVFFILGLVTLSYMTLKVKSKRTYILLIIISLLSLLLSYNRLYWFYLLSSIYLIFILYHYSTNYDNKKNVRTLSILIAFGFLLFGHIHFLFVLDHKILYLIGQFLELAAYIIFLINLILVLKK